MSNTPLQDPPAQGLSSGSGHTLPSRPLQPFADPSASKRVCFYKSGDYKFSGHRMIITARTFKTFDALLDALSKKVPLPFGVRTITTPRGTHLIRALDDLQDGGAYVCSDQKRVKPLNLDEVNRRQVPWNTTRPPSARRRRRQGLRIGQLGRSNVVTNRPTKVTERVAVRTPKRLEVIKNRDPTIRRTIVLQRRTAPTFDALLDHLSQILQFPVLKLYSTDGRRVDGLAALILCCGVVVAAGNEPFRLGNFNFHASGQIAQVMYMETVEPSPLQPRSQKNKSFSSGRGSRNFSLSSERYIVNQINKSQNGNMNDCLNPHNGSFESETHQYHTPMETRGKGNVDNENNTCIVPHEDDIEKSFRVNQDGSMTVEMKVHLTIKEEEMLHWTTTVSRSSLSKSTVCASVFGSGNSSPDLNNAVAKDSNIQEEETKEENYHERPEKGVGFNDEHIYEGFTSTALGKTKGGFKRTPTPGPRHVNKKASVESVKMVTERGVQESTLGHYSYMERTTDGETTEEYCLVRHSSSSRPIPKPRKTASAGASKKPSSLNSSGVAEVLQIQNDGMEVTETVMHIYESQGCYDNYFANEEYSADGASLSGSPPVQDSRPSTEPRPHSSNNDCDIDCNWQPPTADSVQRQKEEMLSLSSEPESLTHQVKSNQSSEIDIEAKSAAKTPILETVTKDNTNKSKKKKRINRPDGNLKKSSSTSSTDKKQEEGRISSSKHSKYSSTDKLSSNASVGRKSLNSVENSKAGSKNTGAPKKAVKSQSTKSLRERTPRKDIAISVSSENVKSTTSQRQNLNKTSAQDNGHNVNTPTGRPQMKKNLSDILQPRKSPVVGKTTITKPKSMIEGRLSPPKISSELSECSSMPSLNPTSSEIHQYVENWLENVSPHPVQYAAETIMDEPQSRTQVVFKIGDDSDSDERSECQNNLNETMKKSSSCLSVPLCHQGPATSLLHSDQRARGLCVSMPSVRADLVDQENKLRPHRSAEAIGPDDSEVSSSNILSPKEKIRPVLQQLCSSIQCIRRASTSETTPTLHNSNSLPNFSTQVASVFGSSCKALLSFLSVTTLKESLKGSEPGESNDLRTSSEAMFMMQKISAIDDEEEQRASLTDLQSRASSQFRDRWKDFQILRERLESEPLSPRVSETEFALDVVSEGGDVFEDQNLGIDELMDELNMPQDLREEITSTIQHAKTFYPVEESTYVETVRHQSDSEEDVEQFVKECEDETKHSPEPERTAEGTAETKQENSEHNEVPELETEGDEPSNDEPREAVECVEIREYRHAREIDADEVNGMEERKNEEDGEGGAKEMEGKDVQDSVEENRSDMGSVETLDDRTEEQMTGDEEKMGMGLDEDDDDREENEETGQALVNEESGNDGSVEDTDEREGAEETEMEENIEEEEPEENQIQDAEDEVETTIDERDDREGEDCFTEETKEVEEYNEGKEEISEEKDEENMVVEEEYEMDLLTQNYTEEEITEAAHEKNKGRIERKYVDNREQLSEVVCEESNVEDEEKKVEEGNEEEEFSEKNKDNDSETDTEGEKCKMVEETSKALRKTECLEAESAEEEDVRNQMEGLENMATGHTLYEEERDDDDDDDDCDDDDDDDDENEGLKETEEDAEEGIVSEDVHSFDDDEDCKNVLEEVLFLQQHSEKANAECNPESPTKHSSEGHCEDDKCSDSVHEVDEGGDEHEKRRDSLSHPVEISQELLDFVNYALQTCSLAFTYDNLGNIRIEPENARVVQTKQSRILKVNNDSSYGLKCLPSPNTSDLSDYRPETSESGGYKTQQSLDLASESGEEALVKPSPVHIHSAPSLRTNVEQAGSRLSVASSSEALHSSQFKSSGSFSSSDAGNQALREDLSYYSATSSLKDNTEADTHNAQCVCFTSDKDSADGVLIDRGRWLLKENHLIRKSPPVALGMYGNLDSSSIDTGQDNTSEDSLPHSKILHSPLAAISSSELEEMAKPLNLKCTYYNMPHGSDSDPFLDDSSIRSGKHDSSNVKGKGFRVSPIVDTSKTWANRNGSLSSFASVEFKVPDRKVHPEGEPSTVRQVRRTSSGEQGALQAQDSLDSLRLRCGQYCPIL